MNKPMAISGIVLAGGRATRMEGRDKGLIPLLGRPLIAHVLDRLEPQVSDVVINANRHQSEYAQFGVPVVADTLADFSGPLAGILAALPRCREEWALVVACDCPLLPTDLGQQLVSALKPESRLAVAHDGERLQPLFLLLHKSLETSLEAALAANHHKVERWCMEQEHVIVPIRGKDAFRNINTETERLELEALLQTQNLEN